MTDMKPPRRALSLCLIYFICLFSMIIQCNLVETKCPCNCHCDENVFKLINCSKRNLKTVPTSLPPSTETLLLNDNMITRLSIGQFEGLKNIKAINLSSNYISNLYKGTFSGVASLQTLDVSFNRLTSSLSFQTGCFDGLLGLRHLFLQGNLNLADEGTNYPDVALSVLSGLKSLHIDGLSVTPFGSGFSSLFNLTILSLSGNVGKCAMYKIEENTFSNLQSTNVQVLDLSRCDILFSEAGPFSMLHNLRHLDMSNNHHLGFTGLRNATKGLRNTKIQNLNFDRINSHSGVVKVTSNQLKYLGETNLSSLNLNDNMIGTMSGDIFNILPKSLSYIYLRNNLFFSIKNLRKIHLMDNLIVFDISGNKLNHSISYQTKTVKKYTSSPKQKKTDSLTVASSNDIILPPRLRFLYASSIANTVPIDIPTITFSGNELELIDISFNRVQSVIGKVIGLHSLMSFDLSHNDISYLSPFSFGDMRELKSLFLGYNMIELDDHDLLFSNQTNIETLDLSFNRNKAIPKYLFARTKRLKSLNLSYNRLSELDFTVKQLKYLQILDLSFNQIQSFDESAKRELDEISTNRNLFVNLLSNPLQCTCKELKFILWMNKTSVKFTDFQNYTCAYLNGSDVRLTYLMDNLEDFKMTCLSTLVIVLCSVGFFFLCFFLAIPMAIYVERRRVRYFFKIKMKRYRRYKPVGDTDENKLLDDNDDKLYDAYLSYDSSREMAIVVQLIKRNLERKGITVFARDLDVPPGSHELHGIYRGIASSTVIIILLTHDMFNPRENQRQTEMDMVIERSICQQRKNIISCLVQNIFEKPENLNADILEFFNIYRPFDPGDKIENLLNYIEEEMSRLLKQ